MLRLCERILSARHPKFVVEQYAVERSVVESPRSGRGPIQQFELSQCLKWGRLHALTHCVSRHERCGKTSCGA